MNLQNWVNIHNCTAVPAHSTKFNRSYNLICVCVIRSILQSLLYNVFHKSDRKIEITITTTNLIGSKYPLSSFNYRLSGTNVANFNKIHHTVSEQQLFKNGTQKQKFPIRKSRFSSSYTIISVAVCVQSGRRLHGHMRVVEHATVELLGRSSGRSNATPR